MHGATLGPEAFTDFDYADDVALLSELLSLLLSALKMFCRGSGPRRTDCQLKENENSVHQ